MREIQNFHFQVKIVIFEAKSQKGAFVNKSENSPKFLFLGFLLKNDNFDLKMKILKFLGIQSNSKLFIRKELISAQLTVIPRFFSWATVNRGRRISRPARS